MTHRNFLLLALLLLPLGAAAQVATTIDTARRAQVNEGWGVSLCWWANMCGRWSDERLDTLVEWLVSPRHLNYNIFRYNIGGGDDPLWRNCRPHHFGAEGGKGLRAEMEGFKDSVGGAYHWERDAAQRRVLRKIRERRPDAVVEAFSNSAPYFLTESGCAAGARRATDDNVPARNYEAFARYLVDVCLHFRDAEGVEFRTLAPFNEPVTDYWYAGGSQEGCHFGTEAQVAFVRVIAPMLRASGLRTELSASDETDIAQSVRDFRAYAADGEALRCVAQWNTHSYKGGNADREELSRLARAAGKRLWMSESGDGGRGIHGNLMMAQRLIDDIRHLRPDAWVDWQYVEEFGDQWSLVRGDWGRERFERVKNYDVRYHFTHFIRQGYTYIDTDCPQLLAAIAPDGRELVAVVVNTDAGSPRRHDIDVRSFARKGRATVAAYRTTARESVARTGDVRFARGVATVELPPLSVVTLVFSRAK